MKYNLILFDLDDTLLDFHGAQEVSLKRTLEPYLRPFQPVLRDFREINQRLWKKFENGQISKDEVVTERFRHIIDKHKFSACPTELNTRFLNHLSETALLIEGAEPVCSILAQRARGQNAKVGIVTNGVAHVQHQRLKQSGLDAHFDFVCVSEECGYSKPQPEIFRHAIQLSGLPPSDVKALMIGDRLDVDVLGAQRAGFDACWFNPSRSKTPLQEPSSAAPHYIIHHLSELLQAEFLSKEKQTALLSC